MNPQALRVGFQGERGAYSEAAALAIFPEAEPVPCVSLEDVFSQLVSGELDAAVVPIENSLAGSIVRTYDLLRQHDLFVTGEAVMPIEHCLLALPGQCLDEIERVHSHPQALDQCDDFLREHGIQPIPAHDTAGAARMIAEEKRQGEGALASRQAAEDHELEVLAEDVQTAHHNRTRFLVLERSPASRGTDEQQTKTSLVFATDHSPGALYRALTPLAEHEVNMLKLESRPSRGRPWEYVFHLDIQGHREDPEVRAALADLAQVTTMLKVLGSYPAADEPLM